VKRNHQPSTTLPNHEQRTTNNDCYQPSTVNHQPDFLRIAGWNYIYITDLGIA